MGTRSSDFNYKVALASGLKSLQAGRLRQAEEQFRYLLTRFPAADGGYRGLAKVLIEEEDRPSALRMLLDGGAAVAKAGQRAGAIGLYRDATALDPQDLTAHRRLAAALMLTGDQGAAAAEYVRYVQAAQLLGSRERARSEAEYALERLPGAPELTKIARALGIEVEERAPVPEPAPAAAAPAEYPRTEAAPISRPWRILAPAATEAESAREAPASDAVPIAHVAPADPWTQVSDAASGAVSDPQAITLGGTESDPPSDDADSQAVEAAAARYLAKRDPRGGAAALEAARRYIADGRNDAASDLLLQLIASGVADHEAQRLLVDVVRTLGKRDVAKAKCQLLVQALRLDGREDLAAEVEQLALAD